MSVFIDEKRSFKARPRYVDIHFPLKGALPLFILKITYGAQQQEDALKVYHMTTS